MTKQNFKQSKTNDKFRGIFPFEFADGGQDAPAIPEKIHLIPIGQWDHDLYGPIIINNADIREFIQNFNAGVRKGVFITAGHEGFQEQPAVGWITEVESKDDGLWGTVAWNPSGEKALNDKEWKFFSPEMCRDYEDPETHEYYRNVLTGGALTKSPYFKELKAIVFSDKNISNNNLDKKEMSKTLEEVLKLDADKLTVEDKAVLEAGKDTLTDEQKAKFFPTTETAEEKTARLEKETGDANEAAGLNRDGSVKTIEASEKKNMVTINASELEILRAKANEGAQAFAELEKNKLNSFVKDMLFSETNKAGKFLPKSESALTAFSTKLNTEQRLAFSALFKDLVSSDKFTETGAGGGAVEGTAFAEVESKIALKQKENTKMTYSEALKQVMAENEGLELRFDKEIPAAKD